MRREALSEHLPALWGMLRESLFRYRWRFVVVMALLPLSAASATLIPYLTKTAVDEYIVPAIGSADPEIYLAPLGGLVGLGFVVVLIGYLADAFYVQILQRTGQHLIAELRDKVYAHTLRLPRRYYDRTPIGAILTRVTSDIEALGESLASNVLSMFVDLLKTIAFVAMMLFLSWRLTLVLAVLVPLLIVVVQYFQVRVRRSYFRARQALSEATGYLQECLHGMKTVQLYRAESRVLAEFKARNRGFYRAQNASNLYDALLYSLVEGLTSLTLALVLWYAAGALLAGTVTLGVLVAFIEYIQRLFVPVRELSSQLAVLQRAMAALDNIGALFTESVDEAEVPSAHGAPARPLGRFDHLAYRGVRFAYEPEGPPILHGIDFDVRRGESLAIVGATGSGKSSIIRLLTREYGGYCGSIRLNDRELTEVTRDELGALVSVVHQGVFLFEGTIAENIGLHREGIGPEQIARAASYVHADRFIEQLDRGYDFQVMHGGANLSAGQCQLISFARAVAAQTDVIVLDEATSSVDSVTERMIEQALERLYRDKTVIAIAHRLSTIRNADRILVLDAGRVAESGNHGELMARRGHYAALVEGLVQPTSYETTSVPG